MLNRIGTAITIALLISISACGEDPNNSPPVGSGAGSGLPPTASAGDGGSGGMTDPTVTAGGSDGSGTGGMTISPEGPGGVCPGTGLFERPMLMAPLWEMTAPPGPGENTLRTIVSSPTIDGFENPGPATHLCSEDVARVCIGFESEADIPALQADMQAAQLATCRSLTPSQVKALGPGLGWIDYPDNALGTDAMVFGASCSFENTWSETFDDQIPSGSKTLDFDFALEFGGSECASGDFTYVGFCDGELCPNDDGGSDSSGGADETGDAEVIDCSAFSASNVTMTQRKVNKFRYARDVVVAAPLADSIREDIFGSFSECGKFTISPSTLELWDIHKTSILAKGLSLAEGDEITEACSSSGCTSSSTEMADLLIPVVYSGGGFEFTTERAGLFGIRTTFDYTVTFPAP